MLIHILLHFDNYSLQTDCEQLCSFIKSKNASLMDKLLKTQRVTQEKSIYGHELDQKLKVRGYLSKNIGEMIREKEDVSRRIQGEIFNLNCHYVTGAEYKRELEKSAVAKSMVKSLGLVALCGVQAIAFMLWAF